MPSAETRPLLLIWPVNSSPHRVMSPGYIGIAAQQALARRHRAGGLVGEHDGDLAGAAGNVGRELREDLLGLLLGGGDIDAAAGHAGGVVDGEAGGDGRAQLIVGGQRRGGEGKLGSWPGRTDSGRANRRHSWRRWNAATGAAAGPAGRWRHW